MLSLSISLALAEEGRHGPKLECQVKFAMYLAPNDHARGLLNELKPAIVILSVNLMSRVLMTSFLPGVQSCVVVEFVLMQRVLIWVRGENLRDT